MKLNKALLSGLALAACLTASAQEQGAKTENVFLPHFYLQGQIGGQYTLGEIKFSKLLSPNAQLGVGYQFSPVFGLRLSANAWQSKGGWKVLDNTYKWKYNYVAPGLDLTFNLSNLFCGYNPKRVFNITLLAGGGANIAWNNDEANDANTAIMAATAVPSVKYNGQNLQYLWDGTHVRAFGRAGLGFDFRVSDAVSLGIEANANVINDHYNSKKAGNADWYFNALAGIKINLGKTHTTREIPAPKPQEKVIERVVEKVVEKPAPVKEEKADILQRNIFFTISSSEISAKEEKKVAEVANYLAKNPNAKVRITGYADVKTGNAKINSAIAKKRAEAVVNALENKYGVSADRISWGSKGDTVQPFSQNDDNRVAICVAE